MLAGRSLESKTRTLTALYVPSKTKKETAKPNKVQCNATKTMNATETNFNAMKFNHNTMCRNESLSKLEEEIDSSEEKCYQRYMIACTFLQLTQWLPSLRRRHAWPWPKGNTVTMQATPDNPFKRGSKPTSAWEERATKARVRKRSRERTGRAACQANLLPHSIATHPSMVEAWQNCVQVRNYLGALAFSGRHMPTGRLSPGGSGP